tara:strand:- start:12427 stop:13779 length:1353 start_codon:yes stop_codon:yes gene_type:complete
MNIKLKFNEISNNVIAIYSLSNFDATQSYANGNVAPLTQDQLDNYIKQCNFEHFYQLEENKKEFLKGVARNQNISRIICQKRDAILKLSVTEQDMKAYLTYLPAFGGKNATYEYIINLIKESEICHGIKEENIKKLLKDFTSNEVYKILIAEGISPIDGCHTKFNSLINNTNKNDISLVEKNDKLMQRIPATTGKAGKNIFGFLIPAKAGIDLNFHKNLLGAKVSEKDPNILVATTNGLPIINDTKVDVESVLRLANVNLSTGNINYTGSIIIEGDVSNGMLVNATGDIYIKGDVGQASIIAGGNIIISGGVIGGKLDITNLKKAFSAVLKSGKKVHAEYFEYCEVFAKDSIVVKDYILHGRICSNNSIMVHDTEGNQGQVIGGILKARNLIKADNIGNNSNAVTKIVIENQKGKVVIVNNIKAENTINIGYVFYKLNKKFTKGIFMTYE